MAAREIYDAVRLLAAAVHIAGPNRARVRDYLASGATYSGLGGPVSFDQAGNSQSEYVLHGPAEPSIQATFWPRASTLRRSCKLAKKPPCSTARRANSLLNRLNIACKL